MERTRLLAIDAAKIKLLCVRPSFQRITYLNLSLELQQSCNDHIGWLVLTELEKTPIFVKSNSEIAPLSDHLLMNRKQLLRASEAQSKAC